MARLPDPGNDAGIWGDLLNEFLAQAHNADGTLKDTGIVAAKYSKPSGGIPETDLDSTVQTKLNAGGSGSDATTTTKGIVQLAGDLAGTATAVTVAPGAITASKIAATTITDAQISGSAAIAQSKIASLTSDLTGKASTVHTHIQSDVTNLASDLAAKAADTAVVHNTGNETIAGIKTFSASPIMPTPTTGTQAANKNYVDTTVASGAVDATSGSKGVVQLAGDLGGTAASPTVPDLANKQPLSVDLTAIVSLAPNDDDLLQRKAGAWTNRTAAQVKTDLGVTKSDVGLGNVDNTSDANKPISTAASTALAGKVPTTRSISSSTGLSGGGNLSADLTLSVTDNTTTQKVEVAKGGTLTGTRKRVNLIEGSNVTITTADNSGSDRVDVTIAATAATPSDATTGSKGIVQLAGDLSGSAATPTVASGAITAAKMASGTITDTQVAAANKDGSANVPSLRTLGTSSTQAAAGNHLHSGQYASTLHASTHSVAGSDPITEMGPWEMVPDDGTGAVTFNGSTNQIARPDGDTAYTFGARRLALRPLPVIRGYFGKEFLFGSPLYGPLVWAVYPGTGSASNAFGGSKAETGTLSHPAFTEALGLRINYATATSVNATASVASAQAQWTPGTSVNALFGGFWFHARMNFPDASYVAGGASTGVRIFVGMTDQSVANALGADNPAGSRLGFQLINVNGGKTQTNFQVTMRNGTTETLLDTGVAITQDVVYEFYLWCQPGMGNGYCFWHIWDMTNDLHYDGIDGTSPPAASSILRAMAGIQTIDATARTVQVHRISVESGVS